VRTCVFLLGNLFRSLLYDAGGKRSYAQWTMNIETFLTEFLDKTPKGNSIADRIRHWIAVYENPQSFTTDASPYAVAAKRKAARQNLKRLAARHQAVAEQIMREVSQ